MVEAFKRFLLASSTLICALGIVAQSTTQTSTKTASPYYISLPEDRTQKSEGVIIELQPGIAPFMICYYPVSGNYCTLPRVLFYLTITAALVLRHYPWLRVGALAASLTYSGTAAIHASLIIWSGPAEGELDVIPLISILSASCFVMVPLLTWSSTICHAGKPKEEKRHQNEKYKRLLERLACQELPRLTELGEEDPVTQETFARGRKRLETRAKRRESGSDNISGASRTILIMWACLVTVGFIATFVAVIDPTPDFFISSDFLGGNNCIDPCPNNPTLNGRLWFREYSDLQSLTESQLVVFETSSRQTNLILNYAFHISWICVYVLLQVIFAICLGLNQPSEARIRIYGSITQLSRHFTNNDTRLKIWQTSIAKVIAFIAYFGAVVIAVISLPLLVLNVTLIELYIQRLPQSEKPRHVGAWSPYATIGLTLFSFFIANVRLGHHLKRLWADTTNRLTRLANFLKCGKRESKSEASEAEKHKWQEFWMRTWTNLMHYIVEKRDDVLDALQFEWAHTRDFWKDSEGELAKYQQRKQEIREEIEVE
ncbi:hypothetical protein N431DRAFT_447923 [Stipitochalara longipes BDJ]|nr:hypothetical protein N431DRAFT_447923 [Stipitochalara longipes BDJ]